MSCCMVIDTILSIKGFPLPSFLDSPLMVIHLAVAPKGTAVAFLLESFVTKCDIDTPNKGRQMHTKNPRDRKLAW